MLMHEIMNIFAFAIGRISQREEIYWYFLLIIGEGYERTRGMRTIF